jgi:hypothetical protein
MTKYCDGRGSESQGSGLILIPVNNPLERILGEITVAFARPTRPTKRYLNIELPKNQQMRGAITA